MFLGPLTAITAAVVGAILNLFMAFLAGHVFWPTGIEGSFQWAQGLIALGAAAALFRFRASVIPDIIGCALVGICVRTWVL